MLLLTLRYTGLRLNELVNLRTDEVDLDARRISLVGKGRKQRVVPIPRLLEEMLREYLDELRPKLPASPYLFANPRGNGSLRGRYGARALHNLVLEGGTGAGVTGRHHPHRWRHTYATSLVRRGEDIHVVQRLMGHSNIATTTRYLHLSDADLLEAVVTTRLALHDPGMVLTSSILVPVQSPLTSVRTPHGRRRWPEQPS